MCSHHWESTSINFSWGIAIRLIWQLQKQQNFFYNSQSGRLPMVIKFYILWWNFSGKKLSLTWRTKASKHTCTIRKSTSINKSGRKQTCQRSKEGIYLILNETIQINLSVTLPFISFLFYLRRGYYFHLNLVQWLELGASSWSKSNCSGPYTTRAFMTKQFNRIQKYNQDNKNKDSFSVVSKQPLLSYPKLFPNEFHQPKKRRFTSKWNWS